MADPKTLTRQILAGASAIPTDGYPPAPQPNAEPAAAAVLRDLRSTSLDAAGGPQAAQGIRDVVGRGAAAVLGAPVDLAAMALRPAGYSHEAPVGGSEWIGQQLESAGAVSPVRRPAAELLATLPMPAGAGKLGGALAAAISPEGKARLLADLLAGKGSGTYRLGDVTEGQSKALQRLGMAPTTSRDVMMTDDVLGHLRDGRVLKDGFTPEDVTKFTEQAMSKSSQVELNTAKAHQNPALVNRGLVDAQTGKRYDAQMPLRGEGGTLTPATVFPRGLPGRNKKAPE